MRYIWQHIFTLLDTYTNAVPLHYFLKQYYRNHPKLGSRDRRGISDAVYAWYRCGKAFKQGKQDRETLVIAALFLCNLPTKALANRFPEHWQQGWDKSVNDRIDILTADGYEADLPLLLPAGAVFSEGITADAWLLSIQQQPDLFVRIRKRKEDIVKLLSAKGITYRWLNDNCLALPNGTAIDGLLPGDSYVIQDASSQATGTYLKAKENESWWDCCSGAGGKSLLLRDAVPNAQLLASDVRETILRNLKDRFTSYHLKPPVTFTVDAADSVATAHALHNQRFDGIICDVPCSGSGTWARTPEQLYFFDPAQIEQYGQRQEAILRNALTYVKDGGRLVYITCSVFRRENEDVVERAGNQPGWHLSEQRLINGIDEKADCLFVAVFEKD